MPRRQLGQTQLFSDSGAASDGPAGPAEDGAGCKLRFGLEEPVRLSGAHGPLQSNHAQDSEPGGVSGELEAATRPAEKVENIKTIVPKRDPPKGETKCHFHTPFSAPGPPTAEEKTGHYSKVQNESFSPNSYLAAARMADATTSGRTSGQAP